jgi:TetR/AcrR family transcriptional regulator, lmrAB and yxaGH operons repressor
MAHKTISDEAFLDKALDLFRSRGYEGVSLSQLSAASGLEKASLFYRYPGGKNEVVMAVVKRVIDWFEANVFAPLKEEGAPRKRIGIVASKLRTFYNQGTRPCITDVLSIAGGSEELAAILRVALEAWLKAFTDIAREAGMPLSLARSRAEEAIVRIEGSLVLARVLGNSAPFLKNIRLLPELLTSPRQAISPSKYRSAKQGNSEYGRRRSSPRPAHRSGSTD